MVAVIAVIIVIITAAIATLSRYNHVLRCVQGGPPNGAVVAQPFLGFCGC